MPTAFAELSGQRFSWLWPEWIPDSSITLLEGYPGCGKSLLSIDLAARLSIGVNCPLSNHAPSPGRSLFICPEDDMAITVRNRLVEAGADLHHVQFADSRELNQIKDDPTSLIAMVKETETKLVVVDPISSLISTSSEQVVRRVLGAYGQALVEIGATMLLIRHVGKASAGPAITHGLGTTGLAAVARSVLRVDEHPFSPDERLLVSVKSNCGALPKPIRFQIVHHGEDPYLRWLGQAEEGLINTTDPNRTRLAEAVAFLCQVLGESEVPVRQVLRAASDSGISRMTLRRAKESIGILHRREGFGPDAVSYWSLPLLQEVGVTRRRADALNEVTYQLAFRSSANGSSSLGP